MQTCHFCDRWFKNKQAVRRHLGYCKTYLNAEVDNRSWTREELWQCAQCRERNGFANTDKVTFEAMHQLQAACGGCPHCGHRYWQKAGWRRVPAPP